jgi:hypothetical protein
MAVVDKFANAKVEFAGPWVGWDGESHLLFTLEAGKDPKLYGEYKKIFAPNRADYNLEFGLFGFFRKNDFGNPDPAVRRGVTAEESQAIKHRLGAFAHDPTTFPKEYPPPGKFRGGLTFRPDWIIERPPEP